MSAPKFTWLAFLIVLSIFVSLALCGAVAMAAVVVGDPVVAAQGITDSGWSLIQQYGLWWGGLLAVYGAWSTYLKKTQSSHPIAQGKTLAAILAATALVGTALQAHFAGTPWSGVLLTLVLGIFKLVQPVPVPQNQAT